MKNRFIGRCKRWEMLMNARLQIDAADREVARIMALSDDEITAETIAAGLDPHEEAEKCRAVLRRAMDRIAR